MISSGTLRSPYPHRPNQFYYACAGEREAYLYWQNAGAFLIQDGIRVVVDRGVDVDEQTVRLYLLGSVMAVLLHQRGRLVLHASGIDMDGRVAAFLGASGKGKSTLAAALHQRGYPLIADDVVALAPGEIKDGPMVTPGFPRMKLWPDTLTNLGTDPEVLPRVHSLENKRSQCANTGFALQMRPLRRLYILAEGPVPSIEPLPPQEALVELIRNTARIEILPFAKAPMHLQQCATLINHVSVARLSYPRSFNRLQDVACLIESDFLDS